MPGPLSHPQGMQPIGRKVHRQLESGKTAYHNGTRSHWKGHTYKPGKKTAPRYQSK